MLILHDKLPRTIELPYSYVVMLRDLRSAMARHIKKKRKMKRFMEKKEEAAFLEKILRFLNKLCLDDEQYVIREEIEEIANKRYEELTGIQVVL